MLQEDTNPEGQQEPLEDSPVLMRGGVFEARRTSEKQKRKQAMDSERMAHMEPAKGGCCQGGCSIF